jgi:hypothetical protein
MILFFFTQGLSLRGEVAGNGPPHFHCNRMYM